MGDSFQDASKLTAGKDRLFLFTHKSKTPTERGF